MRRAPDVFSLSSGDDNRSLLLDCKGRLRHEGGVVDAPGMYVLGLPMLRRRKSSFIHGIEDDARELMARLADYLEHGNGLSGSRAA